jgi:hypothetical protein
MPRWQKKIWKMALTKPALECYPVACRLRENSR